eukprot:760559-Prorocentrum_lima.AAC.1
MIRDEIYLTLRSLRRTSWLSRPKLWQVFYGRGRLQDCLRARIAEPLATGYSFKTAGTSHDK